MERFKNADKQRCTPGLRRKTASNQLSGLGDGEEVYTPWKMDIPTPITLSSTELPAESLLAPLEIIDTDHEREHWRLKEKRAMWNSSLPTDFEMHPNHVTPGHTLEYINRGVPAPRKKLEDFSVSTKHKRRCSSQ